MSRANYGGLVIAGLGFFLTRFTVTLAIYDDPVRFYLAGVVPLALGLGLAAFGVALTVADVESRLVRTTAVWCVVGTAGMLVLVVLTLLGSRVEILNALTAIRGFGTARDGDDKEAAAVIADRIDDIEAAVQEVSYLTKHAGDGDAVGVPVDLEPCLAESLATIEDRHPSVSVRRDGETDLQVYANERFQQVFTQLLENAVVHGDTEEPELRVEATRDRVRVTVGDDGPGLPESQRRLLETGDIEEFDDPQMGYGLNVVRLLVESYGGTLETSREDGETAVTVVLSRATDETGDRIDRNGIRPGMPSLRATLVASLLAGVAYGVVSEALGGSVAGIGVFYGTADTVVGWLTHEFHSVVFGFVFVSLLSLVPSPHRKRLSVSVGVAVAWGLVLWLGAGGIIAPLWLRLLGIDAPLPNVTARFFATHLAWGVTLGLSTGLWEQSLGPWLAEFRDGE